MNLPCRDSFFDTDSFRLERFVEAQNKVYPEVLEHLRQGRPVGSWVWYIFPQLRALGLCPLSKHYGIASLREARAYLKHPVLGPRLRECTGLMQQTSPRPPSWTVQHMYDFKLRASMTLFAIAALDEPLFIEALDGALGGKADAKTLKLLDPASSRFAGHK